MTIYPSEAEIEIGFALLGKLISAGADPQLLADGRIIINGPATRQQSTWTREHREAFRSALIGSGRYVKGTLDNIYGIQADSEGSC